MPHVAHARQGERRELAKYLVAWMHSHHMLTKAVGFGFALFVLIHMMLTGHSVVTPVEIDRLMVRSVCGRACVQVCWACCYGSVGKPLEPSAIISSTRHPPTARVNRHMPSGMPI